MNDEMFIPKKKKLPIILLIIDIFVIILLFVIYGPFSFFRDYFVTSAMTTRSHKYFAHVLYSNNKIKDVLEQNKTIESDASTDTTKISIGEIEDTGVYESYYEEQILKKDKDNDLYKLINISGEGYKGYLVAIYDPSKISLVWSSNHSSGQLLTTFAKSNNAKVAINASGFSLSGGIKATGTTIKNGKIYSVGKATHKGGGLIGFNKDNVLVLTKDTAKEAISDGMINAVEFGPFLIVNGKAATFSGNGGWGIANRTAIGQRQDGIVLFVVIDGRLSSSAGVSIKELTNIFIKYKAYNAANLDGGGSSTLVVENKLINKPAGYNYTGERYIINSWMVK